jgi:hypothetical protein
MNLKLKQQLPFGQRSRSNSSVASESSHDSHSDDSSSHTSRSSAHNQRSSQNQGGDLPPAILVYHESARSIVFRDHVRRACHVMAEQQSASATATRHASFLSDRSGSLEEKMPTFRRTKSERESRFPSEDTSISFGTELAEMANLFAAPDLVSDSVRSVESVSIQGFQPQVVPLPTLLLGAKDEFEPLILSAESQDAKFWTEAEREVHHRLMAQKATVKTVKNTEWTPFLHRFKTPRRQRGWYPKKHDDIPPHSGDSGEGDFPFVSFFTPTSLLPSGGLKMRYVKVHGLGQGTFTHRQFFASDVPFVFLLGALGRVQRIRLV